MTDMTDMTETREMKVRTNVINLPKVTSNGLRCNNLLSFFMKKKLFSNLSSGFVFNYGARHIIGDAGSSFQDSVTEGVEYEPVLLRADHFSGMRSENVAEGYLSEEDIRAEAKKLGLKAPPAEVATLIFADIPFDYFNSEGVKTIVIMHERITCRERFCPLKREPSLFSIYFNEKNKEKYLNKKVGRILDIRRPGFVFLRESDE